MASEVGRYRVFFLRVRHLVSLTMLIVPHLEVHGQQNLDSVSCLKNIRGWKLRTDEEAGTRSRRNYEEAWG